MYCRHCGKEIDDKAVICIYCGVPTDNMNSNVTNPEPADKKINGLALAGMIVGIVGAVGGNYLFCIPSIVGLILSIIGYKMVKTCKSGKGFAIAGIIVSAVSLFFWILIWVLAFMEIGYSGVPIRFIY